ncbi:MAG: MazG nucleotide pyrophosphohydrolase domain-containing protein, partial [Gammaproteobacteria bacterium]
EELSEMDHELKQGTKQTVAAELGDMLFAITNLARHLDVDPEQALRDSNTKFEQRFRFIEEELAKQGRKPDDATLDEMEELWIKAKSKK